MPRSALLPTNPLHKCADCTYRRTRGERCTFCARRFRARERARAKLAATPGTVANIGAVPFLTRVAELMVPDGFTSTGPVQPPPFNPSYEQNLQERIDKDCACKWPVGHDRRCPATDDYLRLLDEQEAQLHRYELRLVNATTHINFELRLGDDRTAEWSMIEGTTDFTVNTDGTGGSRTFDRTGVDSSFHADVGETPDDVRRTLLEQIARVASSRERLARSTTVPGLPGGWLVTPEQRIEIAKLLRAGKSYSFTPSGFGTGYRLSTDRPGYGRRTGLPAETSTFFGVAGSLFYEPLDCD